MEIINVLHIMADMVLNLGYSDVISIEDLSKSLSDEMGCGGFAYDLQEMYLAKQESDEYDDEISLLLHGLRTFEPIISVECPMMKKLVAQCFQLWLKEEFFGSKYTREYFANIFKNDLCDDDASLMILQFDDEKLFSTYIK